MKNLFKRMSAGLLALFMVVSLLVGVIPADTFAASYTYNTGTRHDYNTSLSDQAEAYYTGDYTWDKLSNLNGGNENCLDMNNPLFQALHTLMSTTMTNSVSYSSLPTYWAKTDASKGSSGTIWFYADHTGSGTMSREHVWPKSHASFEEKNGGADLHHLRPSISNVNSTRGNMIMGNVRHLTGYTSKNYVYYKNNICEVNDNIKGDVARIFLYVWCRWEEPNLFKNTPNPVVGPNDSKNDGGKVIESLDTLLEWCKIDPVDTWEMSRNDQVQNVQGNRNVFIDYPEFAWLVFGQDVPTDLNTPSNNASGGISGKPSGDGNTGSGGSSSNNGNSGNSSNGGSSSGNGSTTDTSYTQVSSLKDGDKVIIVNPASKMALSMNKIATHYNAGVDVSSDYSAITNSEIFTVKKNSDGSWSFTSASGKKLAMAADFNSLNDTGANDKWELSSAGTGTYYMKNVARGTYLDWYAEKGNWSTYTPSSMTQDYVLAFYTKASTSSGGGSNSGTTTNPPATNPPATQPPATQPPATNPPASQPGASEGTQPSVPATQPSGPAPMETKPLNPNDFYTPEEDNDSSIVIIILAIVAGVAVVAGVVVYFVVLKPKKANAPIAEETPAEEPSDETPTEENE